MNAQTKGDGVGVQLSYSYQNVNRIDFGVNYLWCKANSGAKTKSYSEDGKNYKLSTEKITSLVYGPKLNAIVFFDQDDFHMGTSLGFNIEKDFGLGYIFMIGNSFEYYHTKDFRICPKTGVNFLGLLHLNYSYCLPLNNKSISKIGNHQISIMIRFNRGHTTTILPMI